MILKENYERKETARVLSMVTHDLKSPLNGIIGFADFLKSELEINYPDPVAMRCIEQIQIAGSSMFKLVDNILAMAKIEAGKERPEFTWTVNLAEEIHKTLNVFEIEAKARSIDFNVIIEDNLPNVNWDIKRIRLHVLNNIISNALRFTPIGGNITIKASSSQRYVIIQIQDNGPGIRNEDAQSIFDEMHSGNPNTHQRSTDGHGYGLYNARLFVESHQGKIFAENIEAPGKTGAKFSICLPIDPENEPIDEIHISNGNA